MLKCFEIIISRASKNYNQVSRVKPKERANPSKNERVLDEVADVLKTPQYTIFRMSSFDLNLNPQIYKSIDCFTIPEGSSYCNTWYIGNKVSGKYICTLYKCMGDCLQILQRTSLKQLPEKHMWQHSDKSMDTHKGPMQRQMSLVTSYHSSLAAS